MAVAGDPNQPPGSKPRKGRRGRARGRRAAITGRVSGAGALFKLKGYSLKSPESFKLKVIRTPATPRPGRKPRAARRLPQPANFLHGIPKRLMQI